MACDSHTAVLQPQYQCPPGVYTSPRPEVHTSTLPFLHTLTAVLLGLLTQVHPLFAQVPADTLQVPPAEADTLQLEQMEPSPYTAVGHALPQAGRLIVTRDVIRTRFRDPMDAVADLSGSFRYSTGIPGWPEMWSWHGLGDRYITAAFNGLPYRNILSGRPDYALMPAHVAGSLRLGPPVFGSAYSLDAPARSFKQAQPLTEIRFTSGAPGMQGVRVTHGQERRVDLLGRPGLLNIMGGYVGQGVSGEYPTGYSSIRQTLVRLRYEQLHWALELQNVRSRNNRGAHEGVQPRPGMDYDSIFIRFGAQVFNARARLRNIRNDMSGTLRWRWSRSLDQPVTVSAYWTTQNMTHSDQDREPLETFAVANRYGIRAQQGLAELLPGGYGSFRVEGWIDEFASASFQTDAPQQISGWSAALQDSIRAGPVTFFLHAGAAGLADRVAPEVFASMQWNVAGIAVRAEGITAAISPSWFERHGFGSLLVVDAPVGTTTLNRLHVEAGTSAGAFDLAVDGVWTRLDAPVFLLAAERGVGSVAADAGTSMLLSAGLRVGWRQAAERGMWSELRARYLAPPTSGNSTLERRLDLSEPAAFGDARLGARFVLFGGDLDLDVFVRARGWSTTHSRRFHPATGYYLLPSHEAFEIPARGTLDLFAEAGIRTATVFLSFENALAGSAYPGVIIVPDYPLPATAFRFGVYWPIWN